MPNDGFDPSWTVAGTYDLGETYTRATDSRGHKESHRVSMPPDLWERVCKVSNDPQFPTYDSPAAFIRDAIVHRMQYWADKGAPSDWITGWAVVFSSIRAGQRAERVQQLRDLPGAHRESLTIAFDEGLYDVVIEGIMELREAARMVPDPVSTELAKMASEFEDRLSEIQRMADAMREPRQQ